jgi:cell division protein FtsB
MAEVLAPRARRARPVARAPKAARGHARPQVRTGAPARVRWDRLGRLAMLAVLATLLYLYLSAGLHMLSTWGQSRRDNATVQQMQREHKQLLARHEALGKPASIEAQARRLGMARPGEQQYVLSGLPRN